MSNTINKLKQICPNQVLTGLAMTNYLQDWRGIYKGQARAVVFPKSTKEVSDILTYAYKNNLSIVPQGGNSCQTAAAIPLDSSVYFFNINKTTKNLPIVVNLSKINKIINLDRANRTVEVGAGAVLDDVQKAVAKVGLMLPIDLGAKKNAQIGGLLSTNAGGLSVLRYGNTREQTLGIEVVLPDGKILNMLRALRKNNTGYDLKQLFIGAEGTLGIITKAVMRLYPKPSQTTVLWVNCENLKACQKLFERFNQNYNQELSAYEAMHIDIVRLLSQKKSPIKLPAPASAWQVLIQLDSHNNIDLQKLKDNINLWRNNKVAQKMLTQVVIAKNAQEKKWFWQCREELPNAAKDVYGGKSQYVIIRHDIGLPLSKIDEFIRINCKKIKAKFPQAIVLIFGHLGDGNLHFNIAIEKKDIKKEKILSDLVYDNVMQFNGTFSAEHGIGQVKTRQMKKYLSETEFALMKLIKKNIDPKNILNIGKVLI